MNITGTIENDSIKLPPGVHFPDGTMVEISVPEVSAEASKPNGTLDCDGCSEGQENLAAEREHWLAQSERGLREVWDNDADDVYNELLTR